MSELFHYEALRIYTLMLLNFTRDVISKRNKGKIAYNLKLNISDIGRLS